MQALVPLAFIHALGEESTMGRSYRRSSHTVHDLRVHLVWVTKYRFKVLTKDVGNRIREIIRQYCDTNGIQIIQGRLSKDHVHLY